MSEWVGTDVASNFARACSGEQLKRRRTLQGACELIYTHKNVRLSCSFITYDNISELNTPLPELALTTSPNLKTARQHRWL